MVLRSPLALCHMVQLYGSAAAVTGERWDGSKVTAAEYAGMHGHCHALVDQEPRRGEQASRWTLEMTVGSGAPQQFLRLGPGQAKVLALEELGMGTTAS